MKSTFTLYIFLFTRTSCCSLLSWTGCSNWEQKSGRWNIPDNAKLYRHFHGSIKMSSIITRPRIFTPRKPRPCLHYIMQMPRHNSAIFMAFLIRSEPRMRNKMVFLSVHALVSVCVCVFFDAS